MPKGYAIHVGLNEVDPAEYAGWAGRLLACRNDAEAMAEITAGLGYERIDTLLDAHATRSEFCGLLEAAANELQAGDLLTVTYSGHGGAVPDLNGDELPPAPGKQAFDQTLCLFDGQFIDDELFQYWRAFQEGVRIVMIADCCHSGTIIKDPMATLGEDMEKQRYRAIPNESLHAVNLRNVAFYEEVLNGIPASEMHPDHLKASVRLFAACRDDQYARDGDEHGLFTSKFLEAWREGGHADYNSFFRAVRERVPIARQDPQHVILGAGRRSKRDQRPLYV